MKRRILSIILCLALMLLFPTDFKSVYAASNISLVFTSDQYLAIEASNESQVNFYADVEKTIFVGSAVFTSNGTPLNLTPEGNNTIKYTFSGNASQSVNIQLSAYIDSNYVLSSVYTFNNYTYPIIGNLVYLTLSGTSDVNNMSFSFSLNGTEPTASNVTITGLPFVGKTLSANYTYSDINGDLEGTSTFRWYRSDDSAGLNITSITGATAKTYTLTNEDEGKYISFEVTPVAVAGLTKGSAVESPMIGAITPAPTVSSVMVNPASVSVERGGTQTFNATVTGENNPPQTVNWSLSGNSASSIDADGVLTIGATETAETITVTAVSTIDSEKSSTATVSVLTEYPILAGQDSKWKKGATNNFGFTADADYDKFESVEVDGEVLSNDNYTSESGSTIVTLNKAYLNTLSVGAHTLRINFTDGYSEANFSITAQNPATGDKLTLMIWLCITAISIAGMITSSLLRKKSI